MLHDEMMMEYIRFHVLILWILWTSKRDTCADVDRSIVTVFVLRIGHLSIVVAPVPSTPAVYDAAEKQFMESITVLNQHPSAGDSLGALLVAVSGIDAWIY